MHKDVEAMIIELRLNAVRDTEGPWMKDAIRVHVGHEHPAATFSDIIMHHLDRVVLDCIVLMDTIVGGIRYVVGLFASNLEYLLPYVLSD